MRYRTRLAARRGVLTCLLRGTGVQVGAIFDVRTLLTPPLGAERTVRLSTRMGFRAEMLARTKTLVVDRERVIFAQGRGQQKAKPDDQAVVDEGDQRRH